jgi:hypothetical protein
VSAYLLTVARLSQVLHNKTAGQGRSGGRRRTAPSTHVGPVREVIRLTTAKGSLAGDQGTAARGAKLAPNCCLAVSDKKRLGRIPLTMIAEVGCTGLVCGA